MQMAIFDNCFMSCGFSVSCALRTVFLRHMLTVLNFFPLCITQGYLKPKLWEWTFEPFSEFLRWLENCIAVLQLGHDAL